MHLEGLVCSLADGYEIPRHLVGDTKVLSSAVQVEDLGLCIRVELVVGNFIERFEVLGVLIEEVFLLRFDAFGA